MNIRQHVLPFAWLLVLTVTGCLPQGAELGTAPIQSDPARPMLLSGMGLMQVPDLESHLQSMADREAAGVMGGVRSARVYIVPTRNFVAESGPEGGIFISLGTVQALHSEDAVAFVIGHELAHVALGHVANRSASQGWAHTLRILTIGSMRLAARSSLQPTSLQDLRQASMRDALGADGIGELADDVMFPSWSRDQEGEADQLGLKLAVQAGYSPSGADEVFDRLEEEDRQRELEATRASAQAAAKEAQAAQPQDIKGQVDLWVKQATGSVEREIDAQMANSKNGHGAATGRHDRIAAYIDKAFPDVSGPMHSSEWKAALSNRDTAGRLTAYATISKADDAFYTGKLSKAVSLMRLVDASSIAAEPRAVDLRARLVISAGRFEQARQLLLPLSGQPFVTLDCYLQLIRLDLKEGLISAAAATMQVANNAFNDPQELYPTNIQVLRASGRQLEVTLAMARCYAVGDNALSAECRAASGT